MKKSWLFLLLSVFLILVLAGCTQTNTGTPLPDQEPSAPEVADEAETDHAEDEAADQEDTDADHDDSDMDQDEEEEADTEEEAMAIDAAALYAENCAKCHGPNRNDGGAPALLPDRLTKDPVAYETTIMNGSGPMPAFGEKFSADEIQALIEFILSEPQ